METRFSCYGRASTSASPVNRMMAAFARTFRDGVDINLGVGYVNEKTIPIAYLNEAMQAVAGDAVKYRQAFNYGAPDGSANLIAALRRFLKRSLDDATLERKRLIIGPCGATSVLDSLAQVLAPGLVVTSDPLYYIYADALERRGFEVLSVPEDAEGPDLAALEHKLAGVDDRVAFFYVVTVNNPSCTILSNARRRALYEVAARLSRDQRRKIPIVFDLAYELLLHDPNAEPFVSVLPEDELDIVYEIGTLSKVLAPALRIGYLLGPDGPLMDAMVQRTSDAGFSAPLFVQEMAGYLLDARIEDQLRAVNAGYREKAVAVAAGIEQNLGPFLTECRGGSAGFYYYLTLRDIETHPASAIFKHLTRDGGEPRVLYIPGEYCVHPRGDLAATGRRQLRLSYGFEDVPQILRALELMRDAAALLS
jgi:DNA-binding transcriptional MocR family regulator